ncbi:unnamed protein product [Paramecium pentaurelia]|uniref:OTU domain-containing protein n=1 Tax=Paramecium pentaurelia TaxID=43138 RepID=A0A8S1V655_9CILI|nr:unnamed protein product [Paramecium pentaurelia]
MQKEIYSRLNQFFQKIENFDLRQKVIYKRLSEVEEFQNSFIKFLQQDGSFSYTKLSDIISQTQQQNPLDKQNNSLIIELEQNFNNQLKLIQDQIQQINKKEELEQSWKDKIDKDIKNISKLIEEIQQQKQQIKNIDNERNLQNLKNPQPIKSVILDIYSKTTKSRVVQGEFQYFIHQIQSQSELGKYYNLKLDQKKKIYSQISGFRQVRGDGNCFYTSFGYQYLQLLIDQYDQNEYDQFLNSVIKKMRFRIQYPKNKIEDEITETNLREDFIKRLNFIRDIKNKEMRIKELDKQFRAYEQEDELVDGCFYALSTIFFRNLSLYFIDQSEYKGNFQEKDTLLQWEVECNNNEIVIALLAQQLKINICVFFFDNQQFQLMEYNKEANQKIILLLQPGHYNIGIPKIEE